MKTIQITLFAFFISNLSIAQTEIPDTIYVNSTARVHILFDHDIDKATVGSALQYGCETHRDQLDIKALLPSQAQPNRKPVQSTLMVRFKGNSDYYYAILKYAKTPKKFLYDKRTPEFVKKQKEDENSKIAPTLKSDEALVTPSGELDINVIKKRKNMVMEERNKIQDISIMQDNLLVYVSNIKNDEQMTYIKLNIKNKSSVEYVFDLVTFEVVEKLKKSVSKENNKVTNEIKVPVGLESKFDKVSAYDEKSAVFALPIFATGNGSANSLQITLREQKGTRKIILKVPIKYFVKCEVF